MRLRPISSVTLVVLICAFIALTSNGNHLRQAARIFEGVPLSWLRLELAILGLFIAVMMLFVQRWLVRPVLILLLLFSAGAAWLTDTYDMDFDRRTISDMLALSPSEIWPLLDWGLPRDLLLYGILPAAFVLFVPLRSEGRLGKFFRAATVAVASLGLCAAMLLSDYSRFAAVFREYPDLMARWIPGAPVAGLVSYGRTVLASDQDGFRAVGRDARPGALLGRADKPVVAVLVLGNTSRAANWQIGGYARPTNPGLSTHDITWFGNVTACGTSARISVPCLLSDLPRTRFSRPAAQNRENLLDVLKTAGFRVEWWDNTGAADRIPARIPARELSRGWDPVACRRSPCDDRVFLQELHHRLPAITSNTVIVMRSAGSQGPAYYLRSDPATAPFSPVCNTGELGECTHSEIINSYDNSIAFTDQLLSRMIDGLAAAENVAPLLVYVSDNGESLGEGGIWLHGAPWFMAPPEQTRVPMLSWLSPAASEQLRVSKACLDARAGDELSHDNLFATMLGLLDVTSSARDAQLDLTRDCRQAPAG